MHKENNEVHINDTEASGGSKEGVVRYILAISLVLGVVVLSLVWIVPALTNDPEADYANVTDRVRAESNGESTDSVVGLEDDAATIDTRSDDPANLPPAD
ncbi:hypothetical protein ACXYN8_02370 [Altererythrobacter sp. CAU 1778]